MTTAILAVVGLSLALWAGARLLDAWGWAQRVYLPASVLGGGIALLFGPEVLGRLLPGLPFGLVGEEVFQVWRALPGFLINIVFGALFLGVTLHGPREIWRRAGPQVAFGQALAWGQYAVGISLTLLVLTPLFGVPHAFGALIEIGFEGGHGTAAGLGPTFAELGWEEGQDLALAVATVGVVFGLLLGVVLVNWGVRRGHVQGIALAAQAPAAVERPKDAPAPRKSSVYETIEPLGLHLAYIGIAIGIGWVLLEGLRAGEAWILDPGEGGGEAPMGVFRYVPLFPLAMIGGILLQLAHDRLAPRLTLDRRMFVQLQGVALDFLIVAALATLMLRALAENWLPLLLLVVAGILWCLWAVAWLAPRIMPDFWFERAIGDFGQSMGTTATGLLLLRMVDPRYRTPAYEAFGYKQLLFEPIVGGGVFTAMAVPLIFRFGGPTLLAVTTALTLFWILFGWWLFGPRRPATPGPRPASR